MARPAVALSVSSSSSMPARTCKCQHAGLTTLTEETVDSVESHGFERLEPLGVARIHEGTVEDLVTIRDAEGPSLSVCTPGEQMFETLSTASYSVGSCRQDTSSPTEPSRESKAIARQNYRKQRTPVPPGDGRPRGSRPTSEWPEPPGPRGSTRGPCPLPRKRASARIWLSVRVVVRRSSPIDM